MGSFVHAVELLHGNKFKNEFQALELIHWPWNTRYNALELRANTCFLTNLLGHVFQIEKFFTSPNFSNKHPSLFT
jgi:hypothetical protein